MAGNVDILQHLYIVFEFYNKCIDFLVMSIVSTSPFIIKF